MQIVNAFRRGISTFTVTGLLALGSLSAQAQSTANYKVTPSNADYIAADTADSKTHVMFANTDAAVAARKAGIKIQNNEASSAPKNAASTIPLVLYPADLTFQGGPVLTTTEHHAVYLHPNGVCPSVSSCWGNPEGFLRDLGRSQFIHVVDQYVGSSDDNRYTVGFNADVSFSLTGNMLTRGDLFAILHAVASATNATSYTHMYHLFLPQGIDTCLSSTQCYSPDNPSTFYFCAYHGAVTFSDIGHVIYSVEPYQALPGCHVAAPRPNSELIDSTNSVLSHEVFEAITDPDLNAWWNRSSLDLEGAEIGDECQPLYNAGFLVPTFRIGRNTYEVQLEYSNSGHRCVARPSDE